MRVTADVDVFVFRVHTVNFIPCICGIMISKENNVASSHSKALTMYVQGHNEHWNIHSFKSVEIMIKR